MKKRVTLNIPVELLYSALYWMGHLLESSVEEGALESGVDCECSSARLPRMLSKFLETEYSLFWLEVLSVTGNVGHAATGHINSDHGMLKHWNTHSNLPVCIFMPSLTHIHILIFFLDPQPVHPARGRDAGFRGPVPPSHLGEHTASLLLPRVDPSRFASLGCLGNTLWSCSSAEGAHA